MALQLHQSLIGLNQLKADTFVWEIMIFFLFFSATTISYLSERFVLKLLLVLKEGVQAVFLHDDL